MNKYGGGRLDAADTYSHIKIEYHDPTDTGRVVSQTFSHQQTQGEPLTKARKILSHVESSGNNLPRISIKREVSGEGQGEVPSINSARVILLNAGWDTCSRLPPDMRPTQDADIRPVSPSPRDSDSGIESDCTDGNLSWLLNYRIRELPPVPDAGASDEPQQPTAAVATPVNEVVISEGYKASNNSQRKPPFTYTELIEHALIEKGELTVSGIYNWISNHFPFYKANDDRWKNSVRHNLSINPHFRKGGKAVHGAGHLWTIAQRDETKSWQMRQRINDFLSAQKSLAVEDPFDKELQAATESILEEIQSQSRMEPGQEQAALLNDDIHVEFINMPEGVTGLQGFLAPPVPKQQLVNECGLGSDFFITDINPNQLGLSLDDRIYEEMSLEYYGIKD